MNGSDAEPELQLLASYAGRNGEEGENSIQAWRKHGWAGCPGKTPHSSDQCPH